MKHRYAFRSAFIALLAGIPAIANAQIVFINEIHYDNQGPDQLEGVEIAGPAGTQLAGWLLYAYDGATGGVYQVANLNGTIPDQQNGYGTALTLMPGLQDGPDAVALVNNIGTVVQFLSYEGSFTATDGPASGMTSTGIGVAESGNDPPGNSLQLQGSGHVYTDFAWGAQVHPHNWSQGPSINFGQTFPQQPPDCLGVPGGPAQPGTPCNDEDACTTNDLWNLFCFCAGTPIVCDDVNPCTTDQCVNGTCINITIVDGTPCNDEDPCTFDDHYIDCLCVGTPILCYDAQPCTFDYCLNGVCQYDPIDCDDADPCTIDICHEGGTCTHTPITAGDLCDDGEPCTVNDQYDVNCNCAGTPKDCSDELLCTYDYCDGFGTCHHLAIEEGGPCYDGDLCTGPDTYTADCVCIGPPIDCTDGDPCTYDYCIDNLCHHDPLDCDDGDPCTEDICHEGGTCTHVFVQEGDPCDDGSPCTEFDEYDAFCNCVGSLKDCDDKDPCTFDYCDAAGECQHEPYDCTDGIPCTFDYCLDGFCQHDLIDCDDDDPCTADICHEGGTCTHEALVVGASCDDGNPCTYGDLVVSECLCIGVGIFCLDFDPCTYDHCVGGVCHYDPINCDDLDPCTVDHCDGNGVCQHLPACDDGDDCTDDFCFFGICSNIPIDCDDGDDCTDDFCIAGICIHEFIDCTDGDPCTLDICSGGFCQNYPIDCNDSDPCTLDFCDGGTCVHSPVICDDANPCTDDACVNGSCQHITNANSFTLELQTDSKAVETNWQIVPDGGSTPVCSGSGYPNNSVLLLPCCLSPGCYNLKVMDSFGDGMCCAFGNGGYILRNGNGKRVIDNSHDGGFASLSTISLTPGFCVPIGTDQLTLATCDHEDLLPASIIVASPNAAVSAQYGITNSTSGYQYWIFNPDGGYSRRIFQNMTTGAAPNGATKSCHLQLSSITTNPVPSLVLLNVRVRGRVAGAYNEFGTACRMKIDPAAASCPTTQLVNNIADPHHSCGLTSVPLNGTRTLWAIVVSGANKYQFEFTKPGYSRNIASTTPSVLITTWSTNPLLPCMTYNVRARASFSGGTTWCPFGATCTMSTAGNCGGGGTSQNAPRAMQQPGFKLWPNPNRGDQLMIALDELDAQPTSANIDIFDAFGKLVMTRTLAVNEGAVNTTITLDGALAAGLYVVNVSVGDQHLSERLVIE